MPARKVLTVDTSLVTVLDREQMSVVLSNTQADYFVRNLVAILGELRAGLKLLNTAAVLSSVAGDHALSGDAPHLNLNSKAARGSVGRNFKGLAFLTVRPPYLVAPPVQQKYSFAARNIEQAAAQETNRWTFP